MRGTRGGAAPKNVSNGKIRPPVWGGQGRSRTYCESTVVLGRVDRGNRILVKWVSKGSN